MAIVDLSEVRKSYVKGREEVEVLTGIDLAVDEADFLALMGPSGSGKTTLLNIIGGIDSATSGSVQVSGHDLAAMSRRQLAKWRSENIGFVFQFYNLLPVLSARRNVELPLLLTKLSSKQRRSNADTALDHGKTIVMVTHDPKAASHARHVVHLDKGQLSKGTSEEAA